MDARLSADFTVLYEASCVFTKAGQVVEIVSINAGVTALFTCLPAGLAPIHLAVLAYVVPFYSLIWPAINLVNAKVRHRTSARKYDQPHTYLASVALGEKAPPLSFVVVDHHSDCLLLQVVQLAVFVDKHDDLKDALTHDGELAEDRHSLKG